MGNLTIIFLFLLGIGVYLECNSKTLEKHESVKLTIFNSFVSFGFWIAFLGFLIEKLLSVF